MKHLRKSVFIKLLDDGNYLLTVFEQDRMTAKTYTQHQESGGLAAVLKRAKVELTIETDVRATREAGKDPF